MYNILIESQFLPPIISFAHFNKADVIHLEAQENYQKGSYRNRCCIAGANGKQVLSSPLSKGKHRQCSIQNVQIAYHEPWQNQHINSIKSAYGNAPFFEFYADEIFDLISQKKSFLWQYNHALLTGIFELMGMDKVIDKTTIFEKSPDNYVDLRNKFRPKTNERDMALLSPHPYPQVFVEKHGFLPNLSILDLLFCAGPESNVILSRIETTI